MRHSEGIILQPGEKILFETKPDNAYRWLRISELFVVFLILSTFLFALVGVAFISTLTVSSQSFFSTLFYSFIWMVAFDLAISILIGNQAYKKRYYWITDKRYVMKTGFIGFSIKSVPLERISDLIVSRSFLERIFGLSSVKMETMSGQIGFEAGLYGVKNAEKMQAQISNLISRKRRKDKLTF
jgi:uncharacterized membrane protein YdbT with pleckstrin-like domain